MVEKFGYIIENRYICSVINERLHVFDKLKTALAGRVNNSKWIMGNQKKQKKAALGFSVISLSLIDRNSFNPRKVFNEEALEELALSIKGKGVIQPIVVRPVGNRYEIVCGERRFRASLIAGMENIPACIKELSDDEAEEYAITENLQRKDVSPLEEAEAFSKLVSGGKYDINSLAIKFGKSEAFIRGRVSYSRLKA